MTMLRISTRRLSLALALTLAVLLTAGAGTALAAIQVSVDSPLGGALAEGQVVGAGRIAVSSVDVPAAGVPSAAECASFLAGLSASVNWGDGSPAESLSVANIRSAGAGQCTVDLRGATHRYVLSRVQPYDIVVTVSHGGLTGTGHREVQVIDVPFRGEAEAFSVVAGQPVSGLVGRIRDDNEFSSVGQFSATIDWGDGTAPTPAALTADRPGRYDVAGTHTYASAGTYSLVISVTHAGQTVPLVPATVTVTPAAGPNVAVPPPPPLTNPISPAFQVRNARARLSTLRRRGVTLRIGLGSFTGRTVPLEVRGIRRGRLRTLVTTQVALRGARVVDAAGRVVDVRWRPSAKLLRRLRLRAGDSYGLRVRIGATTLQDTFRPRRG